MMTIEGIASAFEGLSPASDNRWNVLTLVPERLHISRAADGKYAVFLEGELPSFGRLPAVGGLEHSGTLTALPACRSFAALRMTCRDELHGNRVLSHIAYELARRLAENPAIGNEELFQQVEWVLLLLGTTDGMLSPERQRGLVGECLLLRRLLIIGRKVAVGPGAVLQRWWGHQPTRRDFAAEGIAIEVKTTSLNSRQHHIGSIEQLEPQSPGEAVYLYSLGVRSDASSAKKLPHYVADVEVQLIDGQGNPDIEARALFWEQLASYGYDRTQEALYLGAPGYLKPHLTGALYRESDLARVRLESFVGGVLPTMVRGVSYTLDITCDPVGKAELEETLQRLLLSPAVSYQ